MVISTPRKYADNLIFLIYIPGNFVIYISGSELLVRVNASGHVVETVYDAGINKLADAGVFELGDDLIVVMESPHIKRLNFTSPSYPEIDTYSFTSGGPVITPYLVIIFCILMFQKAKFPNSNF